VPILPRIRPKVALFVEPPELLAGEPLELRVRIDAPRPRKVDRIDLWVEQSLRSPHGIGSRFRHHAQLSGSRTLPEGPSQFVAKAVMPSSALPDHRGRRVGVDTLVHVELRSRWRFDVRRSFRLSVRGQPQQSTATPLLFSSRVAGRDEPHLEGSLDRSVLRPGGMLTGRVAAIGGDCRSLEVRLVSTETFMGNHVLGSYWSLQVDGALVDGATVPFAMSIPPQVTPSFQVADVGLHWTVELRAKRGLARDLSLRIPVAVAYGADDGPAAPAPSVGDERVLALWRHMARKLGVIFDGRTLVGQVGEVELTIGSVGGRLRSQLTFPPLGIGLEGGQREGLRWLSGAFSSREKVPIFGPTWNETCYATSREPAQGQAFLAHALDAFGAPAFHAVTDDRLTLSVDAPRDDREALERLVELSKRIAARIPEAEAAMPMPASLEAHRADWERAAAEFEAHFAPGPPCLEALDRSWTLRTRWPSEGPRTSLLHRTTTPIDARLHVGPGEPLPKALSRDARPLAEALAGDGTLRIASDAVEVEREGTVGDPSALEPTLDRLRQLVRQLRVDEGPYR